MSFGVRAGGARGVVIGACLLNRSCQSLSGYSLLTTSNVLGLDKIEYRCFGARFNDANRGNLYIIRFRFPVVDLRFPSSGNRAAEVHPAMLRSRRIAPSLFVVALLLGSASLAMMVLPAPAKAAAVCTITYSTSSPPAQQLAIASSGIYCFSAGTYDTQITVTASNVILTGSPGTTASQVILRPTILTNNSYNPSCLVRLCSQTESVADRNPEFIPSIIYVDGVTGVTVKGLTVDGSGAFSYLVNTLQPIGCIPSNTCFVGILFWGASGSVSGTTVTDVSAYESTPAAGQVPYGMGILVGSPVSGTSAVAISGNTVTYYVKNGITCVFAGTTCTISDNTVSPLVLSEEELSLTASNGIEIGRGATGTISGNAVSGNVCIAGADCGGSVGSDLINGQQATGIITYLASGTVAISGNKLTDNDVGIFLQSDAGIVTSTSNVISGSTYVGVAVYDESQWVSNNEFSGEPVGIEAVSDTPGFTATATISCNTFSSVTTQTTTETVLGANAQVVVGSSYCGVLTTPTLSPPDPPIDAGQSVTFTAAWAGGTSTYTVKLYSSPTSFCYSGSTLVQTESGLPGISTTFSVSPIANSYYCVTVTDSSPVPATMLSGVALVTVNSPLSVKISPAGPTYIDSGQSVVLTALPSLGTAPYSYQWYTGSCASGTALPGQTASTYTASPTSTTLYSVKVSDSSASTPPGIACASAAVAVAGALVPTLSLSPQVVDMGQSLTVTATVAWGVGGSPPYSVIFYSGSSSSCASDTAKVTVSSGSNPQTGITGTSTTFAFKTPSSSTYYCATVTDSAATPATVATSTVLLTVAPALGTVSFIIYPAAIDSGQSSTITTTVTWSGGSSPYAVTLYSGSASSCSSDTVIVAVSGTNPQTVTTGTTATFTLASPPSSSTYYCATVIDAALQTASSAASLFTVNSALSVNLAVSPNVFDSGQSATATARVTWSGGTSPYTVYLYSSSTSGSCVSGRVIVAVTSVSNPLTGIIGTTGTFTLPSPASTTYYCAVVTDSSTPPATGQSSTSELTVNPPMTDPIVSVAPSTVDAGQSSILSAVPFSGGTPPYTCQWLQEAPGAIKFSNLGSSFSCTTSSTPSTSTGPLSTVGAWTFELQVTDSSGVPVSDTSSPATVTVNTALSVTSFGITPTYTDSGMPVTITATVYWVGGTGSYTATLYSGSTSTCSTDTVEVSSTSPSNPETGISTTTASFTFASPVSNTYYCAAVEDGSTPPITVYSSTMEFSVIAPLDPSTTLHVACASTATKDVWTCAATLKGFVGSVAGETVAWSQLSGTGTISFSSPTCTLRSAGTCSVTVTGGSLGKVSIEAAYGGDTTNFNAASSGTVSLTVVQARPVLHVACASTGKKDAWTCTATLKGFVGSVAGETVILSQVSGTGSVSFSSTTCTLSSKGTCTFTIQGVKDGGVGIKAVFSKDAINSGSSKTFSLKVR